MNQGFCQQHHQRHQHQCHHHHHHHHHRHFDKQCHSWSHYNRYCCNAIRIVILLLLPSCVFYVSECKHVFLEEWPKCKHVGCQQYARLHSSGPLFKPPSRIHVLSANIGRHSCIAIGYLPTSDGSGHQI